jgi:hypothetical protein
MLEGVGSNLVRIDEQAITNKALMKPAVMRMPLEKPTWPFKR